MGIERLNFGTAAPNDGETFYTAFPKLDANDADLDQRVTSLETVGAPDLAAHIADPTDAHDASAISFTHDAVGAVLRDLRAKVAERPVSVLDFLGVDPAGVLDSTAGIAAAITAAGDGGALYFPKGVYKFSDHDTDGYGLTQLSGQRWYGDGRAATILRLSASTTNITILIRAADFATDYSIENMQIDGNRANITPAVDLYNHFNMIIGPRGGKRGLYRNLLLANNWGRSLQTSNESVSEYAEDILVDGVWVKNGGTKAVSATQSRRVTIQGCFAEVDPYTAANHPGGVGDGNAGSGSCFECNDAHYVTLVGNHGIQIGSSVVGPGIRFVNSCHKIRAFGNTIEDAAYLAFIQNADDVDFSGNTGIEIRGNAILIADANAEAGTCRRVRVHHNKIIDPTGAYVTIKADNGAHTPEVECYIYNNDFIKSAGSPTHGIYNFGIASPAVSGTCLVYQWGNRFIGSIPNQLSGPAAAEIQPEPDRGWQIAGQSSVAVAHTGDTNETTLATITIPANRLGKNGRMRITAQFSYTNSANNKIIRVRFGNTQFYAATLTTTTHTKVIVDIGNRNSASSQVGGSLVAAGVGSSASTMPTGTVDTTADRNVTLTGQLANTGETVTLETYSVEYFYGL